MRISKVIIGTVLALGPLACGGDKAKDSDPGTTGGGQNGSGSGSGSGSGGGSGSGTGGGSGGGSGGQTGVFNNGGAETDGGTGGMEAPPCDASFNNAPPALQACSVAIEGHYFVAIAAGYTGPLAAQGPLVEGPMLDALHEVNAAGGLKGRCVGALRCDTKADGKVASAMFTELTAVDTLIASVGQLGTRAMEDAVEAVAALGKPFLEANSTPSRYKDRSRDLLFTTGLSTPTLMAAQADALFDMVTTGTHLNLLTQKRNETIKIFADMMATQFETRIKKQAGHWESGNALLIELGYPNLASASGDVWFMNGGGGDAAFFAAAAANKLEPKLILAGSFPAETLPSAELKPYRDRIRLLGDGQGALGPAYAEYYAKTYNTPYQGSFGRNYDTICLLLTAAEGIDDVTDGIALRDNLLAQFADDGTPAMGCTNAMRAVREGATTVSYLGVGSSSRFNEAHEGAGSLFVLSRLTADDKFEPIACYDTALTVPPACP